MYALKAINENLARREYRLLRELAELNVPAVHVVGVVVDRGPDLDAILVTRFLDYSTTYRAVFSSPRGGQPTDRLLDALVELLVRLHLSGFFWGDCSLSNTLFRYDAGTLEAYLVDAETSERHPTLTAGQRHYDVDLAEERVYGELLDLQAGELLDPELDPLEIAAELPRRYERLWDELTREELLRPDDQRYRIAQRLRRLNELGFDADEVELISTPDGNRLKLRTKVSESGHHARKLFLRTGLVVEENQARRLLNDIASFRAYLEQKQGRPVSEMVAASPVAGRRLRPGGRGDPGRPARAACRPPRSSTRSSSTAGTCQRRRASTWERPPRPGPISRPCCRGYPNCSVRAGWLWRGRHLILTPAGRDHGQPDQEGQYRDHGRLDQLAVRLVRAELLELPLLGGGHGLPGAAARVDDARVDPHLEGVIGMETRAAPPDDLPRRGPLHAKRDEQQGQRRGQAADDDGHPAQTQEIPPARSHGCLLTGLSTPGTWPPPCGPPADPAAT